MRNIYNEHVKGGLLSQVSKEDGFEIARELDSAMDGIYERLEQLDREIHFALFGYDSVVEEE